MHLGFPVVVAGAALAAVLVLAQAVQGVDGPDGPRVGPTIVLPAPSGKDVESDPAPAQPRPEVQPRRTTAAEPRPDAAPRNRARHPARRMGPAG